MVGPARLEGTWMTPARLAKACGGRVVRSGAPARGVATDSRGVAREECFVALRGASHDGHRFVPDAIARGAAGVIVSERVDRTNIPDGVFVVRVADTGQALLQIAHEHRNRHPSRVVGITGSCGKTSTKDMLAHVLGMAMPTVSSPSSYNNHVGVPLSLLQIEHATRAAVVEIGTNAPGEVSALSQVCAPDVGIITCVAEAHLAGLGTLDGVAAEKAGLLDGLVEGGVVILNGNDRSCRVIGERCQHRVVWVDAAHEADWFATEVRFHGLGTSFLLQGERPVTLPRLGSHNVHNALSVIAAATELGVPLDTVLDALSAIPSTTRRMEPHVVGEVTVFDDTYNMNPRSARAALAAIAGLPCRGRKIVAFGEMLELGEQSTKLHKELGEAVARAGVELLVTVGEGARPIADGAFAAGLPPRAIRRAGDVVAAGDLLLEEVRSGDLVLCKASRGIRLDRLADRLVRELPDVVAAAAAR